VRYLPRLIAGFIVLGSLLVASPAQAAVTIGPATVYSAPGVAVDPAGTAYIAWRGPESGPGSLQFCRLPRGASQCDIRKALPAPGDTVNPAIVVVSGNILAIFQWRYGAESGMYRFVSTDRGATFGPAERVGTVPFDDATFGPTTDVITGVTNAFTTTGAIQSVSLAESPPVPSSYVAFSPGHPYNGTIAYLGGGTMLAAFTTGSDQAQFRVYSYLFGSTGPNDPANWTPPVNLGVARYPSVAAGPAPAGFSGPIGYLVATDAANRVFARRYNNQGFGPPVTIGTDASAPSVDAIDDSYPGNRLHVAYVHPDADGLQLIHAVSDDGEHWRSGSLLEQSEGGIADVKMATAPDHIGVVVWNAGGNQIRVTPIGPDAPATPETEFGATPDKRSSKPKAKFSFSSTAQPATFECKLDKQPFSACESPQKFKVDPGKHVFQARSEDMAGNVDPTPARFKWKVTRG
jgi:hypothetical protein